MSRPSHVGSSKVPAANPLDSKARAALAPHDLDLIAALERGDIVLIRKDRLLKLNKLPYRQQLEAVTPGALVPRTEATALIQS